MNFEWQDLLRGIGGSLAERLAKVPEADRKVILDSAKRWAELKVKATVGTLTAEDAARAKAIQATIYAIAHAETNAAALATLETIARVVLNAAGLSPLRLAG